jgi:hypothetical protein
MHRSSKGEDLMSTIEEATNNDGLREAWSDRLRQYARNRLMLAGVAAVLVALGLVLGWGWLAALGLAPIILSLLPCVAMCALGLCMMRGGARSCETQSTNTAEKPRT